jgi:spore maturation protein CgeB
MKILFCTNDQSFSPATEPHDFYTGILSLGHKVEIFFYRKKSFFYKNFRRSWIDWMNRRLAEKCIEEGFDLLFVHRGGHVAAETVNRIRRESKCRTVCFFPDNPFGSTSPGLSFEQISAYDLFVCKDTYFADELKLAGFLNVEFLPHAFDPSTYGKEFPEEKLTPFRSDVAFIGSHYGFRETFFSGITDDDVTFRIWGPHWERAKDPWIVRHVEGRGVYGDEKLKIIKASKILIDVQNAGNSVECCDCKTMSFIGGGAFFVTNHKRKLDLIFKVGEEIVTYTSRDELQALIRRYLADEPARTAIASRGRERACRDHTTARRIGQILDLLRKRGLSLPVE